MEKYSGWSYVIFITILPVFSQNLIDLFSAVLGLCCCRAGATVSGGAAASTRWLLWFLEHGLQAGKLQKLRLLGSGAPPGFPFMRLCGIFPAQDRTRCLPPNQMGSLHGATRSPSEFQYCCWPSEYTTPSLLSTSFLRLLIYPMTFSHFAFNETIIKIHLTQVDPLAVLITSTSSPRFSLF